MAWGLQDKRIWEMGGCICLEAKINRRDVKRTTLRNSDKITKNLAAKSENMFS